MRQLFFDCNECKKGLHYNCKHGVHELDECHCISDFEYEEQFEEKCSERDLKQQDKQGELEDFRD